LLFDGGFLTGNAGFCMASDVDSCGWRWRKRSTRGTG